MGKPDVSAVDAYIAGKPERVRPILALVRSTIREALPTCSESVSYQMPTYKLDGAPVLYFAAWKEHYSLYPASREVVEALGEALAPYAVDKGTIKFSFDAEVPVKLIALIAQLRASSTKAKPKKTAAKKAAPSQSP